MCTAMLGGDDAVKKINKKQPNATDVPIGDGLADAAKVSILSRRKRIEDALAAAGE